MDVKVRKYYTFIEDTNKDGVKEVEGSHKKVSIAVVFENPYAGQYVEDLSPLSGWSESVTTDLVERALRASGIKVEEVESYGKAAIVGGNGELEHGAALLHPTLGKPFRAAIGGGKAIIPSAKKMGYPGCAIDVPLHFKDAAYVRTHYDAMEVRVPDAPRDNEIVLILSITNCGRPHPRIGGLQKSEAKCEDGLR